MAAKDFHRDDEGNVVEETIYLREDNGEVNTPSAPEANKAKGDKKQQRKRSTSRGGGGGILKNFRRKGSQGPYQYFDPDEYSTETGRKLIWKCPVELTMNSLTKSRVLFLFEDALIIAKQKSSTNFHLKIRVDLRDIWLSDDYQDFADADFCASSKIAAYRLGWPIATADLEFSAVEEKNSWVEKLQTMLTIVREKEKQWVIVQLAKNDKEFSVTKKFQVGKTDSARNVLDRCAKQFHRKSDDEQIEFQLQALTNANEDPIPLTGSEILYRIQMKYNREHGDGRKDATAEGDAEFTGDGLVFQMIPLEKKPSVPKISFPATSDDHHKAANGTSALARFFRPSQERLHRRNLSELYKDGKLSCRLMEMLTHLYVKGPSSEEIFRRPPSRKTQLVLQEKFEQGKVNFAKVNAYEMSQLLKTFLANLPECLLTNELYDEWFEVPKQEGRTAIISLAKSLVDRLPMCNLVLLKHLMCVLRRISRDSAINGMPPKSLSICIGQCLLWTPVNPTANEIKSEFHRIETVNRVTEVLIDNALDIFGEECFHLFDHLHPQPPSPTDEIKEKPDVIIGSMETETATDMKSEPVLVTSSSDQDITMHSFSQFNHSAEDGTKEDEMGLLHEVSQEMALRLNGPWLHEPPSNPPPFTCAETGTNHDLSLSSSQMNLFPEKQSITDDNNNEEDDDDEEEEDERSITIEDNLEVSNQCPAQENAFLLVVDDAASTCKHFNSFRTEDTLTAPTISAAESSTLCGVSLASDNNRQYYSDVDSKSSTAEKILPSLSGPQALSSVFPVACSDTVSPIPILVFSEISEASDGPVEVAFGLHEQSNQLTEVTSNELTKSSLSTAPAATESKKSHPPILVVPSFKNPSVSECAVEKSSPVKCKANSRAEISTTETKTKFPGRKILSPDDGYSTSSSKMSRGSGGTRRESELVPSRIDKRFSPYSENTSSPSKLSQRSPFQKGRGSNSDSGLRNETPNARSPSSAAIAPSGIVRRLTSQIEQRELFRGGRQPLPPSPQSAPPRGRLRQSPFSPSFKGASGSLSVSPSPVSVHSDATEHHSTLQHSSLESPWRPEFPSNAQRIGAIKSRFVDPVSPSENLHKPTMFVGACSKARAATSQDLLTAANKEKTKPNADLPEETKKPVNEPIISSTRPKESFANVVGLTNRPTEPEDSFANVGLTNTEPEDSFANVGLTNTEPEDSSKAKEWTSSDKGSQKTLRGGDQQLLRHSDPKMTPRQAKERRRSSGGGDDLRTRNKENNKENVKKRPSPTEEASSTREKKVSRISSESPDIGKLEEEISSPTMTTTTETKNMSVKNRDWHRQLTEQYSTAPGAGGAAAAAVKIGGLTTQRNVTVSKKPPTGPKISFTPTPLRVYRGTERSRATATSATAKKS